ncbi:hypothetical protein LINGRAHAP2_LOCUS22937 [Linum grandiflorum]
MLFVLRFMCTFFSPRNSLTMFTKQVGAPRSNRSTIVGES